MRKVLSAACAAICVSSAILYAQSPQAVPVSGGRVVRSSGSSSWRARPRSTAPPSRRSNVRKPTFHAAAASAGIRYSEGRHFRKLWNGLTVRRPPRDIPKLRALPGVQAVYPVVKIHLQQVEEQPGAVADLVTALSMTGADVAQNALGLSGRGVTVAVIDTGIDYDHPDLGGCFGRGCRVEKGFDFVGDAFNADPASPGYNPMPRPIRIPTTATVTARTSSGIIGANGGIKGVAPGVKFHAYRVFGCEGSTTADIMLDAMEMALDDGADVVNMSIGSAFQWPQYPTAKAADRLVQHGVVVVASIGNEGALGLYAAAAPGVGKNVIGVASFDNSHANLVSFTISPDGTGIGYVAAAGAPPPPLIGSFPMARTGTATSADRRVRAAACRKPDREGRADSARHVRLLREGGQRTGRRRRRRRAVQQRRRASSRRPSRGRRPSRFRWSASAPPTAS